MAMVDVAIMKDKPGFQRVQFPDHWRAAQQQVDTSMWKVAPDDDELAMSSRMLCMNEKVDKYVSDPYVKVQQCIKSVERPSHCSQSHCDVDES